MPAAQEETLPNSAGGKGSPTPRRNQQEAQRKRPLVPTDRKLAKERDRRRRMEQQEKIRIANETGDERYLMPRDKGPQKRFARDFVDARWMVGEFLMFIIFGFLILALALPGAVQLQAYVTLGLWVVLAITVVDAYIMTRQLKKRLIEKFGSNERGVLWYASMRGLQFRKMRLPKPQVKRGETPS